MKKVIISAFVILVTLTWGCKESNKGVDVTNNAEKIDLEKKYYLEKGMQIAQSTGSVLVTNLTNAMKNGGPLHALSFCNGQAYPLTDSMGMANHVEIKRVSDKFRNPNNKADVMEQEYIKHLEQQLAAGMNIKPLAKFNGNKVISYFPIMTNNKCLQCHGVVDKDIQPAVYAKINALYPKDHATGYKTNELRGIWVISMDKDRS